MRRHAALFAARPIAITAAALLGATATAHAQQADPHPDKNYVAVVVGVSAYKNMPEEVELDFARSDAANLATVLQTHGKYDVVIPLLDRQATKEAITEVMREKVPQVVGPNDHLLIYFVGHGLGSEFDLATLLAYDSTVQNGQEDGFLVSDFATDIATWSRPGTAMVVTDAIHRNQLDGIFFYGPSADQWPAISPQTFVMSSSKREQPSVGTRFAETFANGMAGAADADADGKITAGELQAFVDAEMQGADQQPQFAGGYADTTVLAEGVTPGTRASEPPQIVLDPSFDGVEIYAAKFVFRDGTNATVACQGEDEIPCDSTCYVRNFEAGVCKVTAFADGKKLTGKTLAVVPGKYDCGVTRDKSNLSCLAPQLGSQGRN